METTYSKQYLEELFAGKTNLPEKKDEQNTNKNAKNIEAEQLEQGLTYLQEYLNANPTNLAHTELAKSINSFEEMDYRDFVGEVSSAPVTKMNVLFLSLSEQLYVDIALKLQETKEDFDLYILYELQKIINKHPKKIKISSSFNSLYSYILSVLLFSVLLVVMWVLFTLNLFNIQSII